MSKLDALQNKDFTIVIDRSGSMSVTDAAGGNSRWKAAEETTYALAKKAEQFDKDGLTLYFFGSKYKRLENVTAEDVDRVFAEYDPAGSTALAEVLEDVFANYLKKKTSNTDPKGEIVLVITDGQPDDQDKAAKVVCDFTQKLDNGEEIGVSFIQVGKDAGAKKFLDWLDNNLSGAKYDVVDTCNMDDVGDQPLVDVFLNALND